MTYGITRTHGTALTGASNNVTGRQSSFFSGYQPLFVTVQTVTTKFDMTTNLGSVNSNLEYVVRAAETVGTLTGYGTPANGGSSSTVVLIFDAASLNQGDGAHNYDTGFGAMIGYISAAANASGATTVASDFAVTAYTGFTGAALSA